MYAQTQGDNLKFNLFTLMSVAYGRRALKQHALEKKWKSKTIAKVLSV